MEISLYTTEECEKIATNASLRYVKGTTRGFCRRKQGSEFKYYDTQGKLITDKNILRRIKTLAIPPAYQNVWICAYANGHIQATGFNAKQKKQYIYHSSWNKARQEQKFDSLIEFGRCLPQIRKHVMRQLKKPAQLNKEQVLCAILYLLDIACIRIGNSIYAKENRSYGVTTLRKKHLSITSHQEAVLKFPGKNAQLWQIILKDKRLIKLLKKFEDIPGYELFKYFSTCGKCHVITSQDVNGYLQSLTKQSFTAKNFRTWCACRETFTKIIKKEYSAAALKAVIDEVAILLGHTPAICRKSYINPEIIRWWESGQLTTWVKENKISLRNKDKIFLFWLENKDSTM